MDKKLVLIEWVDSRGSNTLWEYIDELEPMKPDRITSVGFIWEETDEYKTLVHNIGRTQVLGRITIPCRSILSWFELDPSPMVEGTKEKEYASCNLNCTRESSQPPCR